ncbi:GTP 3',8-cyclase MoaA [Desulfocicer niacini]
MNKLDQDCLTDAFNRRVTYLRLSVTDRCNLNCCYCAPSRPKLVPLDGLMSFEEMFRAVKVGVGLGITKVRLTGGEPLCRQDITSFVAKLCCIPQLKDVGLTTNGVLLEQMAAGLKQAGMKRINISLDTLDAGKFEQITGKNYWDKVWNGIMAAHKLGFAPIKINTVVMKGVNDDEVVDLARLTLKYPFHVRFIEYMPIGTDPRGAQGYFISGNSLRKRLVEVEELIPLDSEENDGPARRFKFAGAPGEIGFISSMSDHFCHRCNRMRLTARGFLRPCLLADDQVDLGTRMRRGDCDETLEQLFCLALSMKKGEHGLNFHGADALKTKMVSIGG